ncbi:hypothetical protein EWM64_g3816 [Hericium alpestre]|uniref:Uncharacterized protein n=1 Tax=Hericium alpestre TaxID=135208 RepID=A0A4Z0A1X7_9AGAM|nr:hypothetical protein EWM64_g3816 [Hericium alpestre]
MKARTNSPPAVPPATAAASVVRGMPELEEADCEAEAEEEANVEEDSDNEPVD